jgi:Mrp family chromosome partitioning ATPase/capsular polysaccharide biosynthesis protein
MERTSPEFTWRDYLGPVIARRWLVLAIVIVVAGATYAYYSRKPPVYTASTELYVGASANPVLNLSAVPNTPRGLQDDASLITTTEMAAVVARHIGYTGPPANLLGGVTAIPVSNADFITITAQAGTPRRAARLANAFTRAYIRTTTAQGRRSISSSIASLQKQLRQLPKRSSDAVVRSNLSTQIQQLRASQPTGGNTATQVDPATPPAAPSNRPAWEYALLAGVAALIAGVLLAYLLHRLDTRLKSVDQALEVYGRPVLGVVLHDPHINAFHDGVPTLSPQSREAFRQLRVALDVTELERRFTTILITSAGPEEGKSAVARNLALAYSEAGQRVALIDGDLRKPTLPKILGAGSGPGLSDVLAGKNNLDEVLTWAPAANAGAGRRTKASVPVADGDEVGAPETNGITFLPAGTTPPNPPAVIESEGFRSLMNQLAQDHDVVAIDSSPLTVVSDIIPLLSHVDAVLVVARTGITDKRNARHALEVISRVPDVNFIGLVVNGLPVAEAAVYGSGYYSYYHYGYGNGYRNGYGSGNGKRGAPRLRRLIRRS